MTLIYCYGVIGKEVSKDVLSGLVGFQGEVHIIPFKDVLAVVSNVSQQDFSQEAVDRNVKDLDWLRQNAPLHEAVVTAIMQKTTILPMKFCTIFGNTDQLKRMLEDKYAEIKYFLHHVQGKVEMSLKVYANLLELRENVKAEDIQKMEEEAATKTPGHAYFVKQKVDILLKDKVRADILFAKQKIINKIKGLSIEFKKNDLLARKVTGKDVEEMVLNIALLVQSDLLADLHQLLSELKEELSWYNLQLNGPFAAYNFIR
jgi:hypothetical protein